MPFALRPQNCINDHETSYCEASSELHCGNM